MNKQLLIDIIPSTIAPLTILEERSGTGRLRLKGKLQEAEVKNGNGRIYPKNTLEKEVNRYIKENVKIRTSMGELDHPNSEVVNLGNVSHLVTNIWWEGNNVMGELEILPTPSGGIAEALVKSGIPLGISSRAMGSVQQMGEAVEVQDDLSLICWDLVSNPSTPNSYMKLHEGLNSGISYGKYDKINSIITDIICTRTGVCACSFK